MISDARLQAVTANDDDLFNRRFDVRRDHSLLARLRARRVWFPLLSLIIIRRHFHLLAIGTL